MTAGDDPIALSDDLPLEAVAMSNTVALAYTKHGGHIGWPAAYGDCQPLWVEGAVLQFIKVVLEME